MKKIFVTAAALTLTLGASAQGNNTGMGGDHEGCTSLAERVLKLEKKNDAFNVYINYAASFQETDNGTEWGSAFLIPFRLKKPYRIGKVIMIVVGALEFCVLALGAS